MIKIKGLLKEIKQHDRLTIKVGSDTDGFLPEVVLRRLLQPHRSDYYFFIFVDSGLSTHKVDLQNIAVSDGQVLFILPNQIHTPPATKGGNKYFKLSFDENCMALLPRQFMFLINPLNKQVIEFDSSSKKRIRTIFEILNQLLHTSNKQEDTEVILAHLNTLLTEFNTAYFRNTGQDNALSARFKKYIEFKIILDTHLAEQYSLNMIAAKLSLTTNSLYSIIKEFAGISPKTFLINRLMLEAQRKLHYSKPSIKELAYELGFSDPDYFSRLFKKSTGKSITKYLSDIQDMSGR